MPILQNEPIWLSAAEIIDINKLEVEETGERHLLRQPDLLESAAARPINLWLYENEEDIVRLAVTLAWRKIMHSSKATSARR